MRPLNEGRDVNPGDTSARPGMAPASGSLNEGRDVNPGDTANCMQERHPGENCPVEWTVAVPPAMRLRSIQRPR